MTTTTKRVQIGCYINQSDFNIDDLNRQVVLLARSYGFSLDEEAATLVDDDATNHEALEYLAEEAIDYLNDNVTLPHCSWYHNGESGTFGLWASYESAREDVGFVSRRERDKDETCNPDDASYPAEDYRGEWLHINDHGNATLYVRDEDGKDTEVWSLV